LACLLRLTAGLQRSWTIAGCGSAGTPTDSRPLNKKLVSKRAEHIQQAVQSFAPRENALYTADGCRVRAKPRSGGFHRELQVGYEYLVVATGTQPDFDSIGGLKQALERSDRPVCSTVTLDGVANTRKCISEFSKGAVVFTHPRDPLACTSPTHSGMFLADHWLKTKVPFSASRSLCLCACLVLPVCLYVCRRLTVYLWLSM
jgi:hypothetical protein